MEWQLKQEGVPLFTEDVLRNAVEQGAADIFLIPGMPLSWKVGGKIMYQSDEKIFPKEIEEMVREIYALANNRSMDHVVECGDDDFAMALPGVSRFRVNVFRQRGSLAAIIRVITFDLPDFRNLNIPQVVIDISRMTKGFVLGTGPAGSGKSTTLACIIDQINQTQEKHIITLEDPLEFLHRHNKSIVSQREISVDTVSYVTALRASLRQSPDVILLGEMRDFETIQVAMTAAETGHLIFSTLHTIGAANTIDRIIDVFPPNQQRQIAVQLSMVLQAVISQQLVPTIDGHQVPAFEIMTVTPAIRNMIRDNKIPQIDGMIYSSATPELVSMDASLLKLYKDGTISKDTALTYATNPEMLKRRL